MTQYDHSDALCEGLPRLSPEALNALAAPPAPPGRRRHYKPRGQRLTGHVVATQLRPHDAFRLNRALAGRKLSPYIRAVLIAHLDALEQETP